MGQQVDLVIIVYIRGFYQRNFFYISLEIY